MSVTNDEGAVDTAPVDENVVTDDVVDGKRAQLEDSRELVAKLEREAAERAASEANAVTAIAIDREQAAMDARIAELKRAAGIEVEPPAEAFGAPLTVQEQAEKDGKYFDPETGLVYDEKPAEVDSSSDKTDEETAAAQAAAVSSTEGHQTGDDTDDTGDQTAATPNGGAFNRFLGN